MEPGVAAMKVILTGKVLRAEVAWFLPWRD
jgi:hypothetical protein